jgi:hypothetical protein
MRILRTEVKGMNDEDRAAPAAPAPLPPGNTPAAAPAPPVADPAVQPTPTVGDRSDTP